MKYSCAPRFSSGALRYSLWIALGTECIFLFLASRFGDFTVPGHATTFVSWMFAAGICFFASAILFGKRVPARPAVIFWCGAVAVRLTIFSCPPGDDMWRYIWEARAQVNGFNPYVYSPSAPELGALRDAAWWRINHREFAAIYPPATELVFAALARISPPVFLFKIVFIAADFLTVLLLLRLCSRPHCVSPEGSPSSSRYVAAAWYAWNPAVAYAFAGGGHFDSLMLAAMTAAVWALERSFGRNDLARRNKEKCEGAGLRDKNLPDWKWAFLSATLLGIAIAVKLVPFFLLPAWMCALRRRSLVLVTSVAIPAALCLVYGGISRVLKPLIAFTDVTRFNDLFWWMIEAVSMPNPFQRNWPFMLALGLACVVATVKFQHDWRRCALWLFGLALVLSPVLHPWYTTWILPLATWRRVRAWAVLSVSSLGALLLWDNSRWWNQWEPNLLTRAVVILPPLTVWFIEWRANGRVFAADRAGSSGGNSRKDKLV